MNPQVGPDHSTAPGGQLVPAGKGHGSLFPPEGEPRGARPPPAPCASGGSDSCLVRARPTAWAVRILLFPPFLQRLHPWQVGLGPPVMGCERRYLVQATVRLLLDRRGRENATAFCIKGMRRRERLPFRSCQQQTPQRPFVSASLLAISFLALGFLLFPAPCNPSPANSPPSPCLRFLSRAASRARSSWTRCGAFWDGPRRRKPVRSGPTKSPSATLPRGSSSFLTRTLCAGWFLRSPPSSFCSWRSSASNFIISPPTPSSSWRSSPILWRCSWGCAPAPPSSNTSTPWLGPGRLSAARSALITSSSGEGWVVAAVDPHDHLELPTEGPQSDRSTWKARPTIPAELDPVLPEAANRPPAAAVPDELRVHGAK
jgi:hypothetical protein